MLTRGSGDGGGGGLSSGGCGAGRRRGGRLDATICYTTFRCMYSRDAFFVFHIFRNRFRADTARVMRGREGEGFSIREEEEEEEVLLERDLHG